MLDRHAATGIPRSIPRGNRPRLIQSELALANEDSHQRIGHRLGYRPPGKLIADPVALGIPLADDVPVVHDDDGLRATERSVRLFEVSRQRVAELLVDRL